jgi:uncharacterized membrane protein
MNLGTLVNLTNGLSVLWIVLAGALSVAVTVLWLYIGWRAMRAHERLASAAEHMARAPRRQDSPPL